MPVLGRQAVVKMLADPQENGLEARVVIVHNLGQDDRDGDNVGDTPYSLYSYVEHLWTFNRNIKFFYGSPLLLVLDFLERLAPFSAPKFVLRDKEPMYIWEEKNIEKERL